MNIRVLNVPYDSGQYKARMGRGPDRLFESGLKPLLTRLGHHYIDEEITAPDSHLAEIKTAFALCRTVAHRVRACQRDGDFPIVLSGNCNTAVGTVSGCGCENTGVVWFDAHGESTTPDTTTSGFLDGMGISILTGQCWARLARTIPGFDPVPGKHILLVGARDLEPDEIRLLDRTGVSRVSDPEHLGSHLASLAHHVDGVYLHIDLDVLDPAEAIANQWAPPGGLTIETMQKAVRTIQAHTRIKALGIASYDPEADHNGQALAAASSITEFLLGAAK
ncbi:MAG: arginase family protein [Acidobacteriia bacterium]|nr:arginase family protein [Terriglobia bacterium]